MTARKRRKISQEEFPDFDSTDEKIDKALQTVNYIATLSNQRRIIKEEFQQKLMHYYSGGTFRCDQTLIAFVKTLVDMDQTTSVTIIDANLMPIVIPDLTEFLSDIVAVHFEAVNEFAVKYNQIRSKRSIKDIVNL